ncbi:hypothetical protein TSA1_17865 [Bradyrhizobium nitroreducens]|uniref:Uncharacterized protein n=1 Tax=Bradyrhizobium nitroreducens TaxID=709803 RepID=A0A2M6UCU9_9BRAD|nr:hypothetical protein [Bradyrhizobium nitroreducens]PIT02416.1 hypothetical protein TSA1_17865 [Bradyrhizobium nitroreducens]
MSIVTEWWEKIWAERRVIKRAPSSFLLALFSSVVLVGAAIWSFLGDRFETRIKNLETATAVKEAEINMWKASVGMKDQQIALLRSTSTSPAPSSGPYAASASVTIQFASDVTKNFPILKDSANIWRWNFTTTKLTVNNQPSNSLYSGYAIFLVFDKPVDFKQVSVTSSKPEALPKWTLADFSERTAMVMFSGELADQAITIRTGNSS